MSVAETFTLPDQPTTGSAVFIPLGGSGFGSPLGYYQVKAQLVDTGTTGFNSIKCFLDDRYTNVVSHIGMTKTQDTPTDLLWKAGLTPTQSIFQLVVAGNIAGIAPDVAAVVTPVLELVDGDGINFIDSIVEQDAVSDIHAMNAVIYVFDKFIRTTTPLSIILNSLGGR